MIGMVVQNRDANMLDHHRYYCSIFVLILACLFINATVSAEQVTGPEEIMYKSITMLNDDCDFACCYAVAGLYTQRFLEVVREATLASLRANPDVNTVIRRGFGGKAKTMRLR